MSTDFFPTVVSVSLQYVLNYSGDQTYLLFSSFVYCIARNFLFLSAASYGYADREEKNHVVLGEGICSCLASLVLLLYTTYTHTLQALFSSSCPGKRVNIHAWR